MKYLVKKDGHILTGFEDIDEAKDYARRVNGHVIKNKK